MNNNKPFIIAAGAIAALFTASLVFRYIVLSQAGLSGGWILYMGLPAGGIIAVILLLFRLGILNFGDKPSIAAPPWQHHTVAQPPFAAPTSQRLQELESMRDSGTISETEYFAKRARIISGL
ncbi:hypothetical protein GCM10009641_11390 [Mycobacterium cookii]|uniref:SHOCT domain-containing protein n=1 Tax=Mycobacterium cookii TaxID=1775 RepID=A0A7I7L1E4_9MYCO|nr:SHOCT domain-containing protein [Mycobacterium cookii]MCV7329675.1 SHOCT domain-containing protein [Mycobacterium cookii]BBX47816.1 hypothetical protein MCOO_38310 [Mycobacterium cookii]